MTVSEPVNNRSGKSTRAYSWGRAYIWGLAGALSFTLGGCTSALDLVGLGDDDAAKIAAAEEVHQIGVNAFLWRATLDTLSFMPMRTIDSKGGVILTEWKITPGNVNERSKVDIVIIGRKLTADALKVTVHRQLDKGNGWLDEAPRPGASINIRNAILMQARLLRRNNAPIK